MQDYQIFVSYRREGGEFLAGRITDKLKSLGYTVFYDVEAMRSGTFNSQLLDAIGTCEDFLLVLPKGALDRCVNQQDWVRLEIRHALSLGKNIIPIIARDFEFPETLPDDIDGVRYFEGVTASPEYFDAVIERICKLMQSKPGYDASVESKKLNESNTHVDNIIRSAEYAISIGDIKKANEMLMDAIYKGSNDHRVYICRAKIDLLNNDGRSFFDTIEKLEEFERKSDRSSGIREDIAKLMKFRGVNGITALHMSTVNEQMDAVRFCVEHGADVNSRASSDNVTPISIMYVHLNPNEVVTIYGTPFVHDPKNVAAIKEYLIEHGAKDEPQNFNNSFNTAGKNPDMKNFVDGLSNMSLGDTGRKIADESTQKVPVNKLLYCVIALFVGYFGIHKFYAKKNVMGIIYIVLFFFGGISMFLAMIDFVWALTKKADENGLIYI